MWLNFLGIKNEIWKIIGILVSETDLQTATQNGRVEKKDAAGKHRNKHFKKNRLRLWRMYSNFPKITLPYYHSDRSKVLCAPDGTYRGGCSCNASNRRSRSKYFFRRILLGGLYPVQHALSTKVVWPRWSGGLNPPNSPTPLKDAKTKIFKASI